ncbi:PREDICTED: aldose 1-epimerase-like, partial [Rhagoletis zephyria]|uniref:aldose 1-epimerase-like n=1 Tax=Rhagoletis zephyria TaxID=28612 RepID=UPI0008118DF4
IANAAFELNGQRYQLTANSGALSLHSGPQGFDKRKWSLVGEEGQSITLEYRAADGESGYPGALRVRIHFTVTDEGELKLQYSAALEEGSSGVSTVVNLTNHSYFNLNGVSSGGEASSILKHKVLMAAANFFIEVDDSLVPTGKLAPVAGTLLDFTGQARTVEERVHQVKPAGYDHCFVLEADPAKWAIAPAELKQAALVVWSPLSGIKLEMATTEPGFQFYTGSKIMEGHRQKASQGKGLEPIIGPYSGFCAEASRFPDAPNQWPAQVVLAPGQQYAQTTVYKFGLASEL